MCFPGKAGLPPSFSKASLPRVNHVVMAMLELQLVGPTVHLSSSNKIVLELLFESVFILMSLRTLRKNPS